MYISDKIDYFLSKFQRAEKIIEFNSYQEEHSERLETEKKKEEMGKVRERIKKLEERKKTAESKETERGKVLL